MQLFTINYDRFVETFIAHDGDKFTMPFSLLLRPTNKGKHGFYPVNSQTESITGVKCLELNFLININIFRALCRESNRKKKLEKAKKTDTSKRFNAVILKMCFLGRPHLKNEVGKKLLRI